MPGASSFCPAGNEDEEEENDVDGESDGESAPGSFVRALRESSRFLAEDDEDDVNVDDEEDEDGEEDDDVDDEEDGEEEVGLEYLEKDDIDVSTFPSWGSLGV